MGHSDLRPLKFRVVLPIERTAGRKTTPVKKGQENVMDALRALIQTYDDGSMGIAQIEMLDVELPGWRDDDARLALGLAEDWTDEQIAEYLCPRIAANNDDVLHPSIAQIVSNRVPDWDTMELAGQA